MMRLEMKNYNMILTEKRQKYQLHNQVKLINMNILQVKKHCLQIKDKFTFSKITYSLLGKAFEK